MSQHDASSETDDSDPGNSTADGGSSGANPASDTTIDPAIPLGADETVRWAGHPRTTVVLPTLVFGGLLVLAGLALPFVIGELVAAGIGVLVVLFGLALPVGHYLSVSNTQYVVSDRALYQKRGVLGRRVTQANLETVQNSSFTQGITGSFFGYGTVDFEVAGGSDLAFSDIHDPRPVRQLVDDVIPDGDGIAGTVSSPDDVPGDVETWRAIRDEVRSLRRLLS